MEWIRMVWRRKGLGSRLYFLNNDYLQDYLYFAVATGLPLIPICICTWITISISAAAAVAAASIAATIIAAATAAATTTTSSCYCYCYCYATATLLPLLLPLPGRSPLYPEPRLLRGGGLGSPLCGATTPHPCFRQPFARVLV